MKILVTGGAGYIGSVLVPALLELGHEVTVLDSLMYLDNSLAAACKYPNFHFIRGNVADSEILASIASSMDLIIPLAAIVGAPACEMSPSYARMINYDSMENLLSRCKNQMIIYPTTNSGYGIGTPEKECTEESPLNPISQYAKEKVEIEKMLLKRGNAISLRLATVFGVSPRMRVDLLVNDFTYRACKDGVIVLFEANFRRNYIHVRDVCYAFIFAINNFETMRNQPYNVGLSTANLTKIELAEQIRKKIPNLYIHCNELNKDPDQRDYLVSNVKIERLGWTPKITLEDGIIELIKFYKMIKVKNYTNI